MDDEITEWSRERIEHWIERRHDLQCREMEDYLRREIVDGYPERRAEHWDRDYDSIEGYLESVEGNRRRWRDVLGEFDDDAPEPDVEEEPFLETDDVVAKWIGLRLFDDYPLRARAIVGYPKGESGPFPLVVCAHGAGSSPEKTFGFDDDMDLYKGFARRLVEEGYAVVSPLDFRGADERRREYEILLQSLGKTVWGFEAFKNRRLVEYLDAREPVDASRLGMWGLSMGGASTLFQMAYDRRIDAGICTGFFNHRLRKHVLDEPRYSNFRPARDSVHFYVPGWFREFSDADLVSLICPRPFMVQDGKLDSISWEPYVREEWDEAKAHYEQLGIEGRAVLDVHNGAHEMRVPEGIAFLDEHLRDGS